jgi:hypothetical protein
MLEFECVNKLLEGLRVCYLVNVTLFREHKAPLYLEFEAPI